MTTSDRIDGHSLRGDPFVASLLSRCTFPPEGTSVTCAVSGGADSSALLILAVASGCAVTAVHVDHSIRTGSDGESVLVEILAGRLGASFESRTCRVSDGPDLEARARTARHASLPADALFGHTSDDQAETVVLRLLRGTGPAGLAAMRSERHPMLGIRRSETVELCERYGVEPFMDPSNTDPRFRRNRVRHEVLPLLSEVAEKDVVPLFARLAAQSAEQADLIATLARALDPTDAKALTSAHRAIAAEALRQWWVDRTGLFYPPDAAAITRILDVAAGHRVGCDVAEGWSVRRSNWRLSMYHGSRMSDAHAGVNPSQD